MRIASVILAAGLGTRMKSSTPKILHYIFDKTLIQYVVESLMKFKSNNIVVVTGSNSDSIRNTLSGYPVTFAVQKEPRGTGDALRAGIQGLKDITKDKDASILVLNGDTPLVGASTLRGFLRLHRSLKEDLSLISFIAGHEHSYGRIVRDGGNVRAIVENKDADHEQKKINEVNSGIYAIKSSVLNLLKDIKLSNSGEYYLTDLVSLAVKKGFKVGAHAIGSETELTGINTREDLYRATHFLKDKVLSRCFDNGVSVIDKASVFVSPDAEIGSDTLLYPNVYIEGKTVIGSGCTIYPNTRIVSSIIGNNVIIKDSTVIESSTIKDKAVIGPFAHIRPDSKIGSLSKIGNFVEIKKSVIGDNSKASHLTYLGDAVIGSNVNIGAGTITCNYDGQKKHKTVIEDDVFIGSDTQLIAPLKVGKGAYIGAGSTITKDVPSLSLAVSRTGQKNIDRWAAKKNLKTESSNPKKRGSNNT